MPWGKVRIYQSGSPFGYYRALAIGYLVLSLFLLLYPPLSLWQLFIVPLNVGLAGFFLRMSRMGARLEPGGVKVVRMIRTIRVPWSQFRRFVIRPHGMAAKLGHVERTDGTFVFIQGLGPTGRRFPKVQEDWALEAMIAEMNREAVRLKQAADSRVVRSEGPSRP